MLVLFSISDYFLLCMQLIVMNIKIYITIIHDCYAQGVVVYTLPVDTFANGIRKFDWLKPSLDCLILLHMRSHDLHRSGLID